MVERVVVFMDWQNVYMRARAAFGDPDYDPHWIGQVDPMRFGERLVSKRREAVLSQVRVYRGIPSNEVDPRGYAAVRRQTAAWRATLGPKPEVFLRTLQYLDGQPPREKGVDVQLAIDFSMMAVRGEYDLGVLASVDTDMKPALDAVFDLNGAARPWAAVTAWDGPNDRRRRIQAGPPRQVPCIWLTESDFLLAGDPTDYSKT